MAPLQEMDVTAEALVVILHGVGGRGAHLAALADMIGAGLPGLAFALPDAPARYDWDDTGRQWFSVAEITAENRPERLVAARASFDRVLDRAITEQGFAGRLNRVALVGFSQGAIMALDAVMGGRWPVAGLACLSGRCVLPGPVLAPATPVMLSHGLEDPVIPAADAVRAADHLAGLGKPVDLHLWTGLGHWFDARVAEVTAGFLRRTLTPAPQS
ncbi:prolyl oligopeptidase family serine peptidase [Gemmobacter fulvus]|uniref:Prolyl oligopeptidase family serine peptidase n=1 Tax=Gemmobacter fulvus TaxID=2840474 RepID=A0A975S294_9RHOB|nr:prolyl oligopeptidase family serine peptidase [Gemmobacter fulvus]MBT9244572.1 prolyl oligopeptidase family serine peptidase [Gemmobacter fulvus]QWK91432.1 prolyl oligopeptidase family serine peptidase [Gemmobacter fulvus]